MRFVLMCLAVVAISCAALVNNVQAKEKDIPLDKLPKAVTEAVKKMFPKAKMLKATMETKEAKEKEKKDTQVKKEEREIEYEVTVQENGKKIDITVDEDGEIELLEKEIGLKDLPKAVSDALAKMYPKDTAKSAEAVYELEDGEEELEFYEVQLKTAEGKSIEVKIKANGKVVKGDGDDDDDDDESGDKEE